MCIFLNSFLVLLRKVLLVNAAASRKLVAANLLYVRQNSEEAWH